MTKVLLKKQIMELFSFIWQDKKKNKNRTGIRLLMMILLYVILFGILGAMFYFVADPLCGPLHQAGMGWLYFALMGLMGTAFGAFGSVFNTYASLYLAKDNELLLSMPIPASRILNVRLAGVYLMGLLYELLVMVPVLIKYYLTAAPGFLTVLCSVIATLEISIVVLIISAILGWAVALISKKTKHKSLITVVLSLGFIIGYYYVYLKAMRFLEDIISNPQIAGNFLKNSLSPVYHMGMAAAGNLSSLGMFTVMTLAVFLAVYLVLAASYTRIITTNRGASRRIYKVQKVTVHSRERALLGKEFRRFLGCPNYILNCGLGIILMIAGAVMILVKRNMIMDMMMLFFAGDQDMMSMAAAAAVCMITTMNDITAPSVSLEGRNIWLVQSLPVSGFQVLMAKLKLHLILTLIPAAILVMSVEIVLKPSAVFAVLIPLTVLAFIIFMALTGLVLNLKMPNLTWTNEIVPIKQSLNVMIALFGGWVVVVGAGALYMLLMDILSPAVYLGCTAAVIFAGAIGLLFWLRKKGAVIFETL
ncbi:putative ABC transporter permease subunit [Blautia sp. HCP3S3_G3]|uniref:putative ABC transporter permease subunit n=1 Tax=Blautia sp. HCP3S3_G3 TaxID=3438913 RepID=UPI003F8C2E3F